MKKITIVYGPQGVGKTAVAKALAAATGGTVVDEWRGEALREGDVAVTNVGPPIVEGARYIGVGLAPVAGGSEAA